MSRSFYLTRALTLVAMVAAAMVLRVMQPANFAWFRPECGALTGLPCIFCGTTRALHHLLNGRFADAAYYNWLAFPLVLLALALAVKMISELACQRSYQLKFPKLTPRLTVLGLAGLVMLWLFQVSLAVAGHKEELLNSRGLLYSLVSPKSSPRTSEKR